MALNGVPYNNVMLLSFSESVHRLFCHPFSFICNSDSEQIWWTESADFPNVLKLKQILVQSLKNNQSPFLYVIYEHKFPSYLSFILLAIPLHCQIIIDFQVGNPTQFPSLRELDKNSGEFNQMNKKVPNINYEFNPVDIPVCTRICIP